MIFTLLVIIVLTILSIVCAAKELEGKAAFFGSIAKAAEPYLKYLSLTGLGLGLVGAFLTIAMVSNPILMLIRLSACILLVILSAPQSIPHLLGPLKIANPAILETINDSLDKITANRVILSYIGLGLAVAVFLTVI